MPRYKFTTLFSLPALLLAGFMLASPDADAVSAPADRATVLETKMALRDLWVEHVFWIRSYALATHAHDAAQSRIAEEEVVSNAKALAATITPFYGQAASDGLFKLLGGHWSAVRDYNGATLGKSRSGQQKAIVSITSNAREIAQFLSAANPNLPEETVFGLLSSHGGHHVAQINQIAAGDFEDEAATWHAMRQHMLVISDAIADALANQFPTRFQERS